MAGCPLARASKKAGSLGGDWRKGPDGQYLGIKLGSLTTFPYISANNTTNQQTEMAVGWGPVDRHSENWIGMEGNAPSKPISMLRQLRVQDPQGLELGGPFLVYSIYLRRCNVHNWLTAVN